MSVLGFLLAVILGVAATPVVMAEGVNLSRYKLTTQVGPQEAHYTAIDPAVLDQFCRDDDGCALSLKLETIQGIRASESRIYLSGVSASWTSSAATSLMVDGDGLGEKGGRVDIDFTVCFFWDLDADALDSGEGFGLTIGSDQDPATCVLVLSD